MQCRGVLHQAAVEYVPLNFHPDTTDTKQTQLFLIKLFQWIKIAAPISYFSFLSITSNDRKHNKFTELCSFDNKQIDKHSKIYSEHFDKCDIFGCHVGRPQLRPSAVLRQKTDLIWWFTITT